MISQFEENHLEFLVRLKAIGVVKYETKDVIVEFQKTIEVVEVPPPDSSEKPRQMTEDELLFMSAKD